MITEQSSFEELEVNSRTYNALHKLAEESGLFAWVDHEYVKRRDLTVGDIIRTDEGILYRIKNFGKRSLIELREELGRHGFQLKDKGRGVKPQLNSPSTEAKPTAALPPVDTTHAKLECIFCGFEFIVSINAVEFADQDCPRCLDGFAKAALTGMLGDSFKPMELAAAVELAYETAEAMMVERQKHR